MRKLIITLALLLAIVPAANAGWSVAKETILASTVIGSASDDSCDISFSEERSATLSDTDDVETAGAITSGDATVTIDTFGVTAGMYVTDVNDEIPVDTTVLSVTSSAALELSANATGIRDPTTLTFIPTACDTLTFTAIGGIGTGNTIDGVAVESVDSSTVITLDGTITKDTTETQTVEIDANYESITVTVVIVADASATSATVEFFAMHQDSVATASFDDETYTSIGGLTKTYMYKVPLSTAPKFRVKVSNLTTESGADDDITVTVTYAGYSS